MQGQNYKQHFYYWLLWAHKASYCSIFRVLNADVAGLSLCASKIYLHSVTILPILGLHFSHLIKDESSLWLNRSLPSPTPIWSVTIRLNFLFDFKIENFLFLIPAWTSDKAFFKAVGSYRWTYNQGTQCTWSTINTHLMRRQILVT